MKKFNITFDIGNIDINDLDLHWDIRNIEINKSEFENLEANSNLGNINSKNINVKNLLNAKNDLGNVDIEIDENEKNYNYRLICDLGKIDINGKRKNKDVSLENNSDNNLNIECDSGNIKLKFKK